MNDLPPALDELIRDPERKRAEAQLIPFIEGLKAEAITPRAICRALSHVLIETTMHEYERWGAHRLWAKQFLREVQEDVAATAQSIEEIEGHAVDSLLSAEAGGGDKPVQ